MLYRLLAAADVFITNFPLPVRERLQIAPAQVLALNPRLIYASFTAYGEVGEDAAKTGFDSTACWARTGLMDIVRATEGPNPRAPHRHGRLSQRHRPLCCDRDRVVSAGEDRAGRRRAVLPAPERPVGQCLFRAKSSVRRARAASAAARAGSQCPGEPLSVPRRALVHHGAVQ